jgi:hypothetical protein
LAIELCISNHDPYSRWRRQLGREDERAQFIRRASNPADVGLQAAADLLCVPQQAIRGVAFEVVPDLLRRIELRRIRWELFQMQPGIGLAHCLDRRSAMNAAAVPEEDDMAAQVPQQHSEELGHVDGLKVVRLEAEVEAQVLALRGHGEGGQRRDPVMLVAIGDDGGLSCGSPRPAARGDE